YAQKGMLPYRCTAGSTDASGSVVVTVSVSPPRAWTSVTRRSSVRETPFIWGAKVSVTSARRNGVSCCHAEAISGILACVLPGDIRQTDVRTPGPTVVPAPHKHGHSGRRW